MKRLPLAIALLLSSSFVNAATGPGGKDRGGGNGAAAEFMRLASSALDTLSSQEPVMVNGIPINLEEMKSTFAVTQIRPTDDALTLDGKSVDAINYPDQDLIVLNSDGWRTLDNESKFQLVLHEIWGLTFHDHQDDEYVYSSALVQLLMKRSATQYVQFVKCTDSSSFISKVTQSADTVYTISIDTDLFAKYVAEVSILKHTPVLKGFAQISATEFGLTSNSNASVTLTPSSNSIQIHAQDEGGNVIDAQSLPSTKTFSGSLSILSSAGSVLRKDPVSCVLAF